MTPDLRWAVVRVVLATVVAVAPAPAGRRVEAQTYVTVVDTERRPVTGLSAEDFAMRDGAVRLPVVDAEPATAPLSVAVVIDGFGAGEQPIVTATLASVMRTLAAADARHQLTPPPAARAPGAFVDALVDACRSLRSAPTDRRVVLAIARRRPGDGAVTGPGRLTDAILIDKVALWTIEVGPAQATTLDTLLGQSVDMGGALREIVPAATAVPDAATRIASLWLSQYVVTYAWPNPMLSQVSIAIRHDRGMVLAPMWAR